MKLEEEMMKLAEDVQDQYRKRMRDEFENRKNHKKLINDRKEFIEKVFEDYEENFFK